MLAFEGLGSLGPAAVAVGGGVVGLALLAAAGLWLRGRIRRAGDPRARTRQLIREGRTEAAGDLLTTLGQLEAAVEQYLASGAYHKACLCLLSLNQPARAAEVYLSHGRLAEAGHYFQAAGVWQRAADCLHHLGSKREAAELYERAGEFAKAARCLSDIADHATAARLFERAGLPGDAAAAWMASGSRDPGLLLRTAELFQVAGDLRHAAECLAGAGEWALAAEHFERLGEWSLAAQAHERAGAHREAAEAYERAEAWPESRANFEKAGDVLKVAELSLRMGQPFEAGRAFYEVGSFERAIEALQGIAAGSSLWREATLLLGKIFLERSLHERACRKLEALEPSPPRSRADLEVLALLATAYERSGDALRALALLEQIEAMDPHWPQLGEWMARLQEHAWGGSNRGSVGADARYLLRAQIGRGGMGVVHLAQDRELERAVAVKFLPYELAQHTESLQLFRQEARAAASMNHPNIVHVYDVAVISGRPCIVMEYVQGQTVRQLIKRGRPDRCPIPPRRMAEIARDTCDALAYAHQQKVIHRDVKPGNIIVSDRGQAKLMDFGISKLLEQNAEAQTRPRGTPQYMPPEQILGSEVDGRADLYALGISIFEGVTGLRPFRGEDVVQQQLNDPMPDPRTLRPEVPPGLVAIIQRACQKDASHRFQSAREMADALSNCLRAL
jgi:tetratricopeptide (TPR) repeat protein